MKGKATTILLIGLVAVVWGIILYRIFAAYQAKDELAAEPPNVTVNASLKEPANDYSAVQDTTKLLVNYRDPFQTNAATSFTQDTLKTKPVLAHSTAIRTVKAVTTVSSTVPVTPTVNWSAISYTGYIRNPATKKLLALMQVNGRELMMSEGETAEQVRLLRNLRDSVKISYQGKTKFITLNTANP